MLRNSPRYFYDEVNELPIMYNTFWSTKLSTAEDWSRVAVFHDVDMHRPYRRSSLAPASFGRVFDELTREGASQFTAACMNSAATEIQREHCTKYGR